MTFPGLSILGVRLPTTRVLIECLRCPQYDEREATTSLAAVRNVTDGLDGSLHFHAHYHSDDPHDDQYRADDEQQGDALEASQEEVRQYEPHE